MWVAFYLLVAAVVICFGYYGVRAYLKFRGTRLVTCPENSEPAAVTIDPKHVFMTGAVGEPDLRLSSCSRWPERQECAQECLRQIEAAPSRPS